MLAELEAPDVLKAPDVWDKELERRAGTGCAGLHHGHGMAISQNGSGDA